MSITSNNNASARHDVAGSQGQLLSDKLQRIDIDLAFAAVELSRRQARLDSPEVLLKDQTNRAIALGILVINAKKEVEHNTRVEASKKNILGWLFGSHHELQYAMPNEIASMLSAAERSSIRESLRVLEDAKVIEGVYRADGYGEKCCGYRVAEGAKKVLNSLVDAK